MLLPPLCGSWRRVPLCEVDELHLICCQALNGDYSAQQTKQCLLSSYDWDLLARSVGPLQDSWRRWQRKHSNVPPSVTVALQRLNARSRNLTVSFSDRSDQSWDAQCQRALDDLHGSQPGHMEDYMDDTTHPHFPYAFLPLETLAPAETTSVSRASLSSRWGAGILQPLESGIEVEMPVPDVSTEDLFWGHFDSCFQIKRIRIGTVSHKSGLHSSYGHHVGLAIFASILACILGESHECGANLGRWLSVFVSMEQSSYWEFHDSCNSWLHWGRRTSRWFEHSSSQCFECHSSILNH